MKWILWCAEYPSETYEGTRHLTWQDHWWDNLKLMKNVWHAWWEASQPDKSPWSQLEGLEFVHDFTTVSDWFAPKKQSSATIAATFSGMIIQSNALDFCPVTLNRSIMIKIKWQRTAPKGSWKIVEVVSIDSGRSRITHSPPTATTPLSAHAFAQAHGHGRLNAGTRHLPCDASNGMECRMVLLFAIGSMVLVLLDFQPHQITTL